MRARSLLTAVLLMTSIVAASAQTDEQKPCSSPEARQFDFWVGEWDLTSRMRTGPGEEDWAEGKAYNTVKAVLNGCVIVESFNGRPAVELQGMSVSSWNPQLGRWQQTWVDNQGGYLNFLGGLEDGKMILSREAEREGKKILQRMVFENITEDSLDWNWERSEDGGTTWTLLWHLHYARKS
jgi:hypothetical protein